MCVITRKLTIYLFIIFIFYRCCYYYYYFMCGQNIRKFVCRGGDLGGGAKTRARTSRWVRRGGVLVAGERGN